MATVILFDVNETMLDMSALDPHFQRAFGDAMARTDWFQTFEKIWLVSLVIDAYKDFSTLAQAALQMTAQKRRVSLSSSDELAILEGMKKLPAHPEVEEALTLLRQAGLRRAALTNGTLASARAQLEYAGIADYFEAIMSADEARRLKPASEPYAMAAQRLGVQLSDIRMVAAHDWDIAGAAAAGCATAFVARPGKVLNPQGLKPELVGVDLLDVAQQILRVDAQAMQASV